VQSAHAQEAPSSSPSTQVQLEFNVPAQCADSVQFADRVHGRSERIQFAASANNLLTITVQGQDANWTGIASFTEADQDSVSRQITARSCDEVVDGLALVAVMVLDPEAMQRASNEPTSREAIPPAPAVLPPAPEIPKRKPPTLTVPEAPGHFHYGIDGILTLIAGPAPNLLLGYGASVHASWVKRHRILSPKLRLAYTHSKRSGYGARSGVADFTLDNITLGLCPIAMTLHPLGVRPCVAGSLGRLAAEGYRTFVPVTERLIWAQIDAQIEIVWSPTKRLEVFALPALGLALRRYSFSFLPYEFYQQPPVILSGTAGVGLQFE